MSNIKLKYLSLTVLIWGILLFSALYVDKIIIARHLATSHDNVRQEMNETEQRLIFNLYKNIQVIKGLPALFAVNPLLTQEQFALAAQPLFDKHTQLRNIAASPNLVIKYMYPIKGNEAAIGVDYHNLPQQIDSVLKAKETGKLQLSGPIELVQGGQGLITRMPVFVKSATGEEVFWGIIAGVIDVDLFYQRSGLLDTALPIDIAIRGKDGLGNAGEVFFGSPEVFEKKHVESIITLPNGSWQIAARPKGGWETMEKNIWQERLYLAGITFLLFLLISRLIQNAMKISAANKKFRDLIKNTPIPYRLHNNQGKITFLNTAFTKTYGYTLKDIPTLSDWWEKAYPDPSYREQSKALWQAYIERFTLDNNEENAPLEVNIQCKDGSTCVALLSLAASTSIKNNDLLSIIYDITTRKKAEEQLNLSSLVFNNTRDGIIITDVRGTILDVNPAFCEITAYSYEDVIGQNSSILSSGKQSTEFYTEMWKTIEIHGYWTGEIWNRKKNGESFVELLSISSILDADGKAKNYIGLFSDITQSKNQQQSLNSIAHYDQLTGLPNRTLLADRYQQAILHSKKTDTLLVACVLDIDNFKPINDQYGPLMGDQLLVEVANRIIVEIQDIDTVSRLGGDEFALLLSDISSLSQCEKLLDRLHYALAEPYLIENTTITISVSSGFTLYPLDSSDLDTLIRHADQAMYQAKSTGKNRYQLFNADKNQQAIAKQLRLDEIHQGLLNDEMQLYYQPKVNMKTGQVFGAEALIRWIHPEQGLIPPFNFLPVIDNTSLEVELGAWVIETALQQLNTWQSQGITLEVSVNISSYHLLSANFIADLEAALMRHPNIQSQYLQLELLESSVLSDLTVIATIINHCRDELGVKIALDDFGTGYSSLTHLRNLRANTIKIDQTFVRDLLDIPDDYAIIDGVIGLAKSFNRGIIAEGVETTEHGLMLMLMGCQQAQGYGIARPMPAADFPEWFKLYIPNQEWLSCGNAQWSERESRAKLFNLIAQQWLSLFENNINSEPADIKRWPIMDDKKCHHTCWIEHSKQEGIYSVAGIEALYQAHKKMDIFAQAMQKKYLADDFEGARADLPALHDLSKALHAVLANELATGMTPSKRPSKTPLILDRIASLTMIRDIDIFEFSFLKTLADMLNVDDIHFYKLNDFNHPCRLIRFTSTTEQSTGKYKTGESKETHVDNIVVPDEIIRARDWINSTGKIYSTRLDDEHFIAVYPVMGLHNIVGYVSITINHEFSASENLVISSLLSISQSFHGLLEENQTDTLTGLLNRKTFDENISKIQDIMSLTSGPNSYSGHEKRHQVESQEYWLAIVDIDYFKRINDTFGHIYGDEVLLMLSQEMKRTFRPYDLLFRFGGEEFVIIVKVENKQEAQLAFERFRLAIEAFTFPQVGQVTISLGATLIMEQHSIPSDIVGRADKALYHAKHHGKNKLFFYEDLIAEGLIEENFEEGEIELFGSL